MPEPLFTAVPRGRGPLSARVEQVARLLASGKTCIVVAGELSLSPSTVRTHRKDAYRALGVCDRAGLAEALGVTPTCPTCGEERLVGLSQRERRDLQRRTTDWRRILIRWRRARALDV